MSSLTLPVVGPLAVSSSDSSAHGSRNAPVARAKALAGYRPRANFPSCSTVITRVQSREFGH